MLKILKSYFNWTYSRGTFHYDVMVTLILLFIFITPHLWDYGDHPTKARTGVAPITVVPNGEHSILVTVQATDVQVGPEATHAVLKQALRKAIEPVTSDAVFVERWELVQDSQGHPLAWKVWAHR